MGEENTPLTISATEDYRVPPPWVMEFQEVIPDGDQDIREQIVNMTIDLDPRVDVALRERTGRGLITWMRIELLNRKLGTEFEPMTSTAVRWEELSLAQKITAAELYTGITYERMLEQKNVQYQHIEN